MTARKLPLALLLTTALSATASHACGPFFPNYLLADRNANLLYMPEGSFALESSRLVAPDPRLPGWRDTSDEKPTPATAQQRLLAEIRARGSLEEAEKMAADLPPAARLYALGSVAFASHDSRARDYFRQLLALPADQQGEWGLKARYSLGRDLMHDYPGRSRLDVFSTSRGNKEELQEAFGLYQQIIDAVRNGADDPEQLALASLGQQGRIKAWQEEWSDATQRYALQAAQGSPTGTLSLGYVASILDHPENAHILQPLLDDPLIQQLLIADFFTHPFTAWSDEDKKIKEYQEAVIATLAQKVNHDFPGSDRLIALAWRNGQYPLAALLLKNAKENGLTSWVRAKMALRDGDVKKATAWYAKAAASFPTDEAWGYQYFNEDIGGEEFVIPACRISAERAILALNRNDYQEAMRLMFKAKENYWADVAWIAERVLTLKELTAFVDKNTRAPQSPLSRDVALSADSRLRALLARRLMRAGQYQKALAYFDVAEERLMAQRYLDVLPKGGPKLAKAQAWWQAALILRDQGMRLTGYEMSPDFALYDGGYSWPYYDDGPENNAAEKSWVSAGERARAGQSQPASDNHFMHYRWQAVKHAENAAGLLPHKSQAYAAVLCNATDWIWAQDPKSVRRLYRIYVKNGAPFPWAENFGRQCPEPDFASLNRDGKK
ncbi:hypothetical protein [Phytobacter massiliensis]|uniref:hypothetical protein n=1 Tax=Phytobacter massiliensis TaxID=1485952 RepID=UPI000300D6DB|nr:hypothetical protein [Phytobacter massiliensis]